MFGGIRYSLFVSHYSPFVSHYSPFVSYYSLFASRYSLFVSHYFPFVSHYSPFVSYYSTFISHYSLFVSHYSTFISHYSLFVFSQEMRGAQGNGQTLGFSKSKAKFHPAVLSDPGIWSFRTLWGPGWKYSPVALKTGPACCEGCAGSNQGWAWGSWVCSPPLPGCITGAPRPWALWAFGCAHLAVPRSPRGCAGCPGWVPASTPWAMAQLCASTAAPLPSQTWETLSLLWDSTTGASLPQARPHKPPLTLRA